jgi:chemotaxis protein MotB
MPSPPPIIIKKKGGHGGHHGGAWKVAYADFVTAMMALFIVLWLMNTSAPVKEAVAGYFKDPSGTSKMVGSGLAGAADNFTINKDNMHELKDQLERAIHEVPEFDTLKNHIDMTVTNEGLRIELTESAAGTFFESGSSNMSHEGADLLKLLAHELGKLPNHIAMEGHTDAKPYKPTASYSNWELSVDRANAARRLMQNSGLQSDQVSQVRGFADQKLRKPDAPQDPSNRRISLIVQYLNKTKETSAEDAAQTTEAGKGEKGEKSDAAAKPESSEKPPDKPAEKTPEKAQEKH